MNIPRKEDLGVSYSHRPPINICLMEKKLIYSIGENLSDA